MLDEVELSEVEKDELSRLYAEGFRYLAVSSLGCGGAEAFKIKPCRSTYLNRAKGGFGIWAEKDYPDMRLLDELKYKRRKFVKRGEYNFLTWDMEPVAISKLLKLTEEEESE